MVKFLTE